MNHRIYLIASLVLLLSVMGCKKDNSDLEDFAILNKHLSIPYHPYNYSSPNLPSYYSNQFITIQTESGEFWWMIRPILGFFLFWLPLFNMVGLCDNVMGRRRQQTY